MGQAQQDTIEVMLSPEQMRALANGSESPLSKLGAAPSKSSRKAAPASARRWPALRIAAMLGVTALVALVSVANLRSGHKAPSLALAVRAPVPAAPVAATPAAPPIDPVRFRNPFDHSEVFEFPPGTSQDDARQAVAEILWERARERRPVRAAPAKPYNSRRDSAHPPSRA